MEEVDRILNDAVFETFWGEQNQGSNGLVNNFTLALKFFAQGVRTHPLNFEILPLIS